MAAAATTTVVSGRSGRLVAQAQSAPTTTVDAAMSSATGTPRARLALKVSQNREKTEPPIPVWAATPPARAAGRVSSGSPATSTSSPVRRTRPTQVMMRTGAQSVSQFMAQPFTPVRATLSRIIRCEKAKRTRMGRMTRRDAAMR